MVVSAKSFLFPLILLLTSAPLSNIAWWLVPWMCLWPIFECDAAGGSKKRANIELFALTTALVSASVNGPSNCPYHSIVVTAVITIAVSPARLHNRYFSHILLIFIYLFIYLFISVSRLDGVRNEVVRARTGVRRELAARVDVNVLR